MKATDRLERIMGAINTGRAVYIQTATRTTKVTKRDVARFDAIGRPLFKADATSLYMSVGRRYDCIDYCKFTVA